MVLNGGMVAYCGPGDTVTSFYLIVGERVELSVWSRLMSTHKNA